MLKTNYEEMIKSIIDEYGNNSYNVKKVLEDTISDNLGEGIKSFNFEMYNKKFHLEREFKVINIINEEFEEKWTYKRIK